MQSALSAGNEDEILEQVAKHAREDHGLASVSEDLVKAVRAHIRVQPAS